MRMKITAKTIGKIKPGKKPLCVYDKELAGFVYRMQPTGHASYYVRVKSHGKWTWVLVGRADRLCAGAARDKALELLARSELGEDIVTPRRTKVNTLREYLDSVYESYAISRYRSGPAILQRIRGVFVWLLDTAIADISLARVQAWAEARLKDGKSTGQTVNRNLLGLRAALQRGVELGYFATNPLAGLRRVTETPRTIVRYLSSEEEARLMDALDAREKTIREKRASHNKWLREHGLPEHADLSTTPFADYLKVAVLVSLNTGLRRNELLSVQWADVAFDDDVIHVRSHAAKGGKSRVVPMNETVRTTLEGWRKMNPDSDLVFTGVRSGGKMHSLRSSWGRVLKEAKIENYRWHDMRHTFASQLVMRGVDLNTVRELLGHADLKMTIRYSHLSDEAKQRAVAMLDVPRGQIIEFPQRRIANKAR